jgi:uncharacterized protein
MGFHRTGFGDKAITFDLNRRIMSIAEKINEDIKKAMLAKDKDRLEALRAMKSAVLLLATAGGSGTAVSDAEVVKAMQKMVKQRAEAATIYRTQNRADMAEVEEFQSKVISEYLPTMLTEAEVRKVVSEKVKSLGAASVSDLPKVMGPVMAELQGKADGKMISQIVREVLSS